MTQSRLPGSPTSSGSLVPGPEAPSSGVATSPPAPVRRPWIPPALAVESRPTRETAKSFFPEADQHGSQSEIFS
jgi:hypothetical protein